MSQPLIVAADLGPADFAYLDGLRRAHFPPERNRLPAHLTMFHSLPPSALDEVRHQLSSQAAGPSPRATLGGLIDLGGGVAFRIDSDDLESIRDDLADHFTGLLTAPDMIGWRAHVTIQNKVEPSVSRDLIRSLERDFRPRAVTIAALSLHRYMDGLWEPIARYPFRGG